MRREEKNLFLYFTEHALKGADSFAAISYDLLQSNRNLFQVIIKLPDQQLIMEKLTLYRNALQQWNESPEDKRNAHEKSIRSLGHKIYLYSDSVAKKERKILESSVQKSKWFLIASLLAIGIAIYVVGYRLRYAALNPLRELESRMQKIADGRFDHLTPPSGESEFITFTDAFNRMLGELSLRQKRMLQTDKLASLGILASGVAHELNNPLSNISTSNQLLAEELHEADEQQIYRWLGNIDSETERARRIVSTLLDFGRQRNFEKQQHRLLDIVNESRLLIKKALQQSAVDLHVNISDKLEIDVDKQRFLQLFINLMQNSINAAEKSLAISISAIKREARLSMLSQNAVVVGDAGCSLQNKDELVEIVFSDDGPGIPGKNLSRVFDPFFSTNEPGHGVGLGLYIVHEIVREHDGCLAIASQPGNGVQITILIPANSSANHSSHGN
jgi:two-component system NtrC family sensor kinase